MPKKTKTTPKIGETPKLKQEASPGSQRAGRTTTAMMTAKKSAEVSQVVEEGQASMLQQRRGDNPLIDAEDMLISQAQTLDDLFHTYARLAGTAMLDNLNMGERLLGLALRCQKQSNQTIKTLADLKNPKRSIFIKRQQNLLQVEQAQAEKTLKQLGASDSAKVDTGSPRETAAVDTTAATLEVQHRA